MNENEVKKDNEADNNASDDNSWNRTDKWPKYKILYKYKGFEVIWGFFKFKDNQTERVGIRWNGDDGTSYYPGDLNNPEWFALPDNLGNIVLLNLYCEVSEKSSDKYLENIIAALKKRDKNTALLFRFIRRLILIRECSIKIKLFKKIFNILSYILFFGRLLRFVLDIIGFNIPNIPNIKIKE